MILHIHGTGTPFFPILKREKLRWHLPHITSLLLEIMQQIQPHYLSIAEQVLTLETENRFSDELKTKSLEQVWSENFSFKYSILWSVYVQLNSEIEKIAINCIPELFLMGFLTLREGKKGPHKKPIFDHYNTWFIYTLFTISQEILGVHELHKHKKIIQKPVTEEIAITIETVEPESVKDDTSQLRIRRPTMLIL